jgi:DNA-binding transcriptional regulator GbsR (MarR family)
VNSLAAEQLGMSLGKLKAGVKVLIEWGLIELLQFDDGNEGFRITEHGREFLEDFGVEK